MTPEQLLQLVKAVEDSIDDYCSSHALPVVINVKQIDDWVAIEMTSDVVISVELI